MKYKRIDEHIGIAIHHGKEMFIALRKGGKIRAPKTEGIETGDLVTFLTDALDRKIVSVMLKKHADEIVKRGSNHLYDVSCRLTHQDIEETNDGDTNFIWTDETIFGCYDF